MKEKLRKANPNSLDAPTNIYKIIEIAGKKFNALFDTGSQPLQ